MSILFFLTGISLCKSNSVFQQRGFLVRKLSGNDALQEGDDVVIVTTDTTLHALRDIVK